MQDQFEFTPKLQRLTYILMGIGLLALIFGIVNLFGAEGEEAHHLANARLWSNLLINTFFFFAIALIGTFFLAIQYAAEAAWATTLKRIMEAISSFVPVGGVLLIIIFLAGTFHLHHLYHWMDPDLYDPASPHYDEIIAGKQGYLNQPFFWARTLLYLGVWTFFTMRFRKRSLEADALDPSDTSLHFKNVRDAAIFLVFFGYSSSTASWDWIMSIDAHWFSTLFGWYVFASMFVSGITAIALVTIYLKSKGYLEFVNDSHIHDLGKFMFGISVFWTYLWFSQFMLIWYSNIPEEVTYFMTRIEDYNLPFFGMVVMNFIFPLLILMNSDYKRINYFIVMAGIVIILGHYMDVFNMIMPSAVGDQWFIGAAEIGGFLFFLGLFIFVVFKELTKAPLLAKGDPYMGESERFHY